MIEHGLVVGAVQHAADLVQGGAAPAFADCAADTPAVEAAEAKLKAGADETKAEGDIKLANRYARLKNEKK